MEIKEQRIPLTIPRVDLVAIPAPPIDTLLSKVKKLHPIKLNLHSICYRITLCVIFYSNIIIIIAAIIIIINITNAAYFCFNF